MRQLRIIVRVLDDVDTTTDPHDVAENMIEAYETDRRHGFPEWPSVAFESAEWMG